jgi:hypothetical protein
LGQMVASITHTHTHTHMYVYICVYIYRHMYIHTQNKIPWLLIHKGIMLTVPTFVGRGCRVVKATGPYGR